MVLVSMGTLSKRQSLALATNRVTSIQPLWLLAPINSLDLVVALLICLMDCD